jgi:hypothetical protein
MDTPIVYRSITNFINDNGNKSKTIIVFSSANTCSKCYENLETYLCKENESKDYLFILVVRYINDLKLRNEFIKRYKVFDYCDTIFFENSLDRIIEDSPKSGIFGFFEIQYTPSILFIENQNITYLDYEAIFKNTMLTKRAKKLLRKL